MPAAPPWPTNSAARRTARKPVEYCTTSWLHMLESQWSTAQPCGSCVAQPAGHKAHATNSADQPVHGKDPLRPPPPPITVWQFNWDSKYLPPCVLFIAGPEQGPCLQWQQQLYFGYFHHEVLVGSGWQGTVDVLEFANGVQSRRYRSWPDGALPGHDPEEVFSMLRVYQLPAGTHTSLNFPGTSGMR